MPFDAPRWQIEIAAADKTAAAFASVSRNMKALQVTERTTSSAMAAGFGIVTRALAPLTAALSVAALAQKAWSTAMEVADLGETADKIGVTVEGLQALQFQAVQGGVGLEQLNAGIGKFSENIGKAAEGDKAMIESLQGLKVKILDVRGNLVPTEDLLVEVARKITAIDDPARKAAAAVDFFGKAGKQMIPTLAEIAKGFGSMSAEAKAAGAFISSEAIAKLDKLADSAAKSHLVMRAMFAENAAGPLTTMLDTITGMVGKLSQSLIAARSNLTTLLLITANPTTALAPFIASAFGASPGEALAKKIETQRGMLEQAQADLAKTAGNPRAQKAIGEAIAKTQAEIDALLRQQNVMAVAGKQSAGFGDPDNIGISVAPAPPKGVLDPTVKKSGGGSDPYKSAIESAKEYTALKIAETAAVGENVNVAARMKHEQELINKASSDANKLFPEQIANLKALAAGMAEADANLAGAKFIDDFKTKGEEFIAQQAIERETLYMSTQAALAYRLEHEAINRAKAEGIVLTPGYIETIKAVSAAQAEAAEQTRKAKEWAEFEKQTFKGFFSDLNQGLREGANIWDTFGQAGENALGKISDKLMDMALDGLWSAAFPGGGGGGSLLGGILGGGASGATSAGLFDGLFSSFFGSPFMFAEGGRPPVGTPYIVGERGPEVRVDGRPGQIFNRRQWNAMSAGGEGGGQRQRIEIVLLSDMLDARIAEGADVRIVHATPRLMSATLDQVPGKMAQHRRDVDGGDHRLG